MYRKPEIQYGEVAQKGPCSVLTIPHYTSAVSYCRLEGFPRRFEEPSLCRAMFCLSKPTVIDSAGFQLSLQVLWNSGLWKRTHRNCPASGLAAVSRVFKPRQRHFFPRGARYQLACLRKGNLESGPGTHLLSSPITSQGALLVELPMLPGAAPIKTVSWLPAALCMTMQKKARPSQGGHGQWTVSLNRPAGSGAELDPSPQKAGRLPPPVPSWHGGFIGDDNSEQGDAVSSV